MTTWFNSRFGVLVLSGFTYVLVATLLRAALLVHTWSEIGFRPGAFLLLFAAGLLYDLVSYGYLAIPLVLYIALVPDFWWKSRIHRALAAPLWLIWCYGLFVSATIEWAFWDEFGARFNFIAVDYLVYTKEVVGNIRESYPVAIIFPAIVLPALALAWFTRKPLSSSLAASTPFRARAGLAGIALVVPLLSWFALDDGAANVSGNRYCNELARNGTYSLFNAFWNNRLDYESYYQKRDVDETVARLRRLVAADGSVYADPAGKDLLRRVTNAGPEKRLNVVIVTMESLSARFMTSFGDERGANDLTPRLDQIAKEGIFFRDYYATGIRTVRGLEALSLSVPPTPGQSVVKRPANGGMFSLGQIFKSRGYDTAFVYGGYGLFDNMNLFFGGNGFRTVDRADLSAKEIQFANVWGVCDEDLFARTLKECDKSFAAGEPFLRFVMTTSNHQPFTYPDGRIDIASGDGRNGAVKYTDYAVGKFLDEARTKPWFDDTIFVIGSDHCENARGKTELPVDKFHIPLMFWSPKHIKPREVTGVCSQIDMAPTLLAMLGWSYDSRFFGSDALSHPPGRAFLCNYLALGLYDGQRLVTLGTQQAVTVDDVGRGEKRPRPVTPDAASAAMIEDAVAWFQGAAHVLDRGKHVAPAPPK